MDLSALVSKDNRVPPLHVHEGSVHGLLTVALAFDHFAAEGGKAGAPADGQAALQLGLDAVDLVVELAAALVAALVHGVHGGAEEQADGLVDVRLGGNGRQRQFGQGLGDADNGFELTDGDGDGRTRVGLDFGGVNLATDGDKV